MQSRREFLKQAGAFALGAPFLIGRGARLFKPSCVIVGAGLAGLAAAYRLGAAGWNVTIIEARDRIGGRVLSYRLPENPSLVCELGAEWVGASHERIQGLCREFGIRLQDHRFKITLLSDGAIKRPGTWHYTPASEAAFEKLKHDFEKYGQKEKEQLDRYDWWTVLEKIGFSQDDLRLRDLFDSTDFGESIRGVSAYAAASEYFESSPENEMDFKMEGGNSRLVEELVARIGRSAIRTGMPVEEIRQRAGRVTLTAKGETFTADACICTVPSRMLEAIRFDPPLPSAQSAAAQQLQYARIIKTSVLYSERFWSDENFSMVSDRTAHYYFHATQNQRDTNAANGASQQGIITSYAIGEKADVLAAQSDKKKMDIVSNGLMAINEHASTLARGVAAYAWQRDRWTEGAYAVYRPGQWFGVRPVLAKPHGKVLFAGEHLADWQGFMEGAVVTGEEAAGRLL